MHVRGFFSERLDGEPLSFAERLEVSFHLAVCPLCKRVFRSLVAAREALHDLRDVDPEKEDGSS